MWNADYCMVCADVSARPVLQKEISMDFLGGLNSHNPERILGVLVEGSVSTQVGLAERVASDSHCHMFSNPFANKARDSQPFFHYLKAA
jgi:hypothetical protein